jgi:hypothetical protein
VRDPFDPEALTPEERLREVASILAQGYLRHRALRANPAAADAPPAPEPGRQAENELDGPGDQSVHVRG